MSLPVPGQWRICRGGSPLCFFYAGGSETPRDLLKTHRHQGRSIAGDLDPEKLEAAFQNFSKFLTEQVLPACEKDPRYAGLKAFTAIHLWNERLLGIDRARSRVGPALYASLSPLSDKFRKSVGWDSDYIDEVKEFLRYRRDLCAITGLSYLDIIHLPWSHWMRIQELVSDLNKDDEARLVEEEQRTKAGERRLEQPGQPQNRQTGATRNDTRQRPAR